MNKIIVAKELIKIAKELTANPNVDNIKKAVEHLNQANSLLKTLMTPKNWNEEMRTKAEKDIEGVVKLLNKMSDLYFKE